MSFLDLPVIELFFKNKRSISTISGYITVSETTRDELEITQQPVQQGSLITDHSFSKPTVLSMQIQFDRTNLLSSLASTAGSIAGTIKFGPLAGVAGGFAAGLLTGGFNDDVLAQTYKKLLDLQKSREPFDIGTPKRIYKSMLFQSLGLVTDKNTENVLSISAVFQQIIIVQISNVQVSRALQKLPGDTGATENAGHKSAFLTTAQGFNPNIGGFRR